MFKYLRKKKGQSTVEYAILIIVVIGALLSIQVYIKRGISGRLKSATDDIGDQFSGGNTNVLIIKTTRSKTRDSFLGGVSNSYLLAKENQFTNIKINVINQFQEFWGKG